MVFIGEVGQFTAQLFSLTNLASPLVTLTGSDLVYPGGGPVGIFNYDNSSGGARPADTTFDNFVANELSPTLRIERDPSSPDVRVSWPDCATTHQLQRTDTIPATTWSDVDNPRVQ